MITRQEEEDRRVRQEVCSITQDESVDEREGVDFLAEILELAGWSQVNDEETEKDLS